MIEFTRNDIAQIACVERNTLDQAVRRGRIDLADLESVLIYILISRLQTMGLDALSNLNKMSIEDLKDDGHVCTAADVMHYEPMEE